jgi:hypothetical protein
VGRRGGVHLARIRGFGARIRGFGARNWGPKKIPLNPNLIPNFFFGTTMYSKMIFRTSERWDGKIIFDKKSLNREIYLVFTDLGRRSEN